MNGESTSVRWTPKVEERSERRWMGAEKGNHSERNIQFDKSGISEDQQERFLSMSDQFSDIFAVDN